LLAAVSSHAAGPPAAASAGANAAAANAAAATAAEKAIMKRAAADWAPTLRLATDTFLVGSGDFGFEVSTRRAGYLTVLQTSTDGTRNVIFPSVVDRDNRIAAGTLRLPRASWRLQAMGPAGTGRLLVVLTPRAPNADAVRRSWAAGRAPDFGARYGAVTAEYQEVAGQAP
jgi:hypothetical protein